MKRGKIPKPMTLIIIGVLVVTMIIVFIVIMLQSKNYEIVGGVELYFLPDEYEEKYNEASKTITLKANIDYLFEITSVCDTGTLTITVLHGEQQDIYSASNKNPCQEKIELVNNQKESITFIISIEPETDGFVKIDISEK